jgi:hypothetical protein
MDAKFIYQTVGVAFRVFFLCWLLFVGVLSLHTQPLVVYVHLVDIEAGFYP